MFLTNAIKYTDKGYVKLDVKCINEKNKCLLLISVEDTGRGIKKGSIEKLFTKFERLDVEQNSTIEGTGLGLLITKEMLTLMGGSIEVRSTYKVGTTVIVKVPQRINTEIKINEELALEWLAKGAIPTDTVKNLLSKAGIMKKFHESKSGK